MSALPAAGPAIGAVAGALAMTNPLDILMASVNSNPYFIGLMMLLLNLGGRFLALEISKEQEKFLSQPMVRRFFLFAVLFVATRNIVIAGGLAIIVIVCLGYLFNENSDLCLWKSCIPDPAKPEVVQENFVGLTSEEAMIYKRLQDKQMAASKPKEEEVTGADKKKDSMASVLYNSALTQINSFRA
jgi:hypothetical protein